MVTTMRTLTDDVDDYGDDDRDVAKKVELRLDRYRVNVKDFEPIGAIISELFCEKCSGRMFDAKGILMEDDDTKERERSKIENEVLK